MGSDLFGGDSRRRLGKDERPGLLGGDSLRSGENLFIHDDPRENIGVVVCKIGLASFDRVASRSKASCIGSEKFFTLFNSLLILLNSAVINFPYVLRKTSSSGAGDIGSVVGGLTLLK